jgi:hypothetical protein
MRGEGVDHLWRVHLLSYFGYRVARRRGLPLAFLSFPLAFLREFSKHPFGWKFSALGHRNVSC